MVWDPEQYGRFRAERLRPARDLLARVPLDEPRAVVDLGCGTGTVTALLRERFPRAATTAVDSSPQMLAEARARDLPGVDWVLADVGAWDPSAAVDLVVSNATLHWLDGHEALFARLVSWLAPGGVLAVQMPRNHGEPSHTLAREVVREGPWRDRLGPVIRVHPVDEPVRYLRLLRPHVDALDVWETIYLHELSGPDPVAAWTAGSVLRPLLDRLDPDETERFLARYRELLRGAYPTEPDGTTVLPFRRLFIVARR